VIASVQGAVHILALGAFIWVVTSQLPRAARQHDRFSLVCSAITGLLALLLFIGIGVRSR
jgi:hypothetical protein